MTCMKLFQSVCYVFASTNSTYQHNTADMTSVEMVHFVSRHLSVPEIAVICVEVKFERLAPSLFHLRPLSVTGGVRKASSKHYCKVQQSSLSQ